MYLQKRLKGMNLVFEFNKKNQTFILLGIFALILLSKVYWVIMITTLLIGFIFIVLGNKKYINLKEKIEDFLL